MIRLIVAAIPVVLTALVACQDHLAIITPASGDWPVSRCRLPFPSGAWKMVHTMQVTTPLGPGSPLVAASLADPANDRVRAVLMAPEGITLLDATFSGRRTRVHRAVPPFDRTEFRQGLLLDYRLLFFGPRGRPIKIGRDQRGRMVCRWRQVNDTVTEVVLPRTGGWIIRLYSPQGILEKLVVAKGPVKRGLASWMKLKSMGPGGYSLEFRLLRVNSFSPMDRDFEF